MSRWYDLSRILSFRDGHTDYVTVTKVHKDGPRIRSFSLKRRLSGALKLST